MSLNPFAAEHPINLLNLPDYACEQLGRAGIRTVDELIATLPKGPHLIGRHTWKHIQLYLEAYLAQQPDVTQNAPHTEVELASYPAVFEDLPSAKLVSDPPEMNRLEALPEVLEARSVTELRLRAYALDCLQRVEVETIGELWTFLAQGDSRFPVSGIGKRLWNEIQEITTRYVISRVGDRATEYVNVAAEEKQHPRVVSPELPVEFLDYHISELTISVRAHNCLQRTGVRTIGHLLTVLPQGYSAVRMAGPKTWSEIEDAVADYMCRHSTISVSAPDTSTPGGNPPTLSASERYSQRYQGVQTPALPADIAGALRERDVATVHILAALPLYQLAQMPDLLSLAYEDWFGLIPIIKDSDAPKHARPLSKNARPQSSLLALNLSARPLNCLARAGILDLHTLAHCTLAQLANLRNFGAKSFEELFARIHEALDSGAITPDDATLVSPQTDAQPRLAAEAPSDALNAPSMLPEPKGDDIHAPESLNLDERLNAWFADLNERQRAVIQWRHGLTDGQSLTLDEIGERLNLTRERVRQIQEKAIRRLQHPPRLHQVHSLIAQLHHVIVGAGGVMSEAELGSSLTGFAKINEANPQGAVGLLLGLSGKYVRVREMQAWCFAELSGLIPLVGSEVIGILRTALAPIAIDDLLSRFKQTKLYQDDRDKLTDQFVMACIHANDKIVRREDGGYGLASWEGRYSDDVIIALRQFGTPVNYSAITARVNAALPSDQQATDHNVHAHMQRMPDVFVRVGHGIYGLAEWGLRNDGSLGNAACRVLRDAGRPLHIDMLTAEILKTWQVQPSSILAAVENDDRIVRVGAGMYCLRVLLSDTGGLSYEPSTGFDDLLVSRLLRWQSELDQQNGNASRDTHDQVDALRHLGLGIFES